MAGWSTSSLIVPALHPLGLQAPMTSSSVIGVTLQLVHPEPLLAHLSPTMFRITGTGRSYHTMHRHDLPIRCLGYMSVPNQHTRGFGTLSFPRTPIKKLTRFGR